MNIIVWVVQGILAAAYLFLGFGKLTIPMQKMRERMGWVDDVGERGVRLIGVVEILGTIGLVASGVFAWLPSVLVPLAATGLAVVQVLAFGVHVRRKEPSFFPMNTVLFLLAAFVAVGRFALAPFGS